MRVIKRKHRWLLPLPVVGHDSRQPVRNKGCHLLSCISLLKPEFPLGLWSMCLMLRPLHGTKLVRTIIILYNSLSLPCYADPYYSGSDMGVSQCCLLLRFAMWRLPTQVETSGESLSLGSWVETVRKYHLHNLLSPGVLAEWWMTDHVAIPEANGRFAQSLSQDPSASGSLTVVMLVCSKQYCCKGVLHLVSCLSSFVKRFDWSSG